VAVAATLAVSEWRSRARSRRVSGGRETAEWGCPLLAIDRYPVAEHLQVSTAYFPLPRLVSHLDQFRSRAKLKGRRGIRLGAEYLFATRLGMAVEASRRYIHHKPPHTPAVAKPSNQIITSRSGGALRLASVLIWIPRAEVIFPTCRRMAFGLNRGCETPNVLGDT